jgi:hypothetical protein
MQFLVPPLSTFERSDNSISWNMKHIAFVCGLVGYLAQHSDCVFVSNDSALPELGAVIKFLKDLVFAVQS